MRGGALTLAGMLLLWAAPADAQRLQAEVRADAIGPSPFAPHVGAGVIVPLGYYARVGIATGYGVRPAGGTRRGEWRGDLLARVTLDPFRQHAVGVSFGGGLTLRHRPYLLAVADIEGPEVGGWLPAVQVGIGGGLRGGVALRRAMSGRR